MRFLLLPLLFLAGLPIQAGESCACATDLSGAWPSGKWESLADGHSGPLSATFERQDDNHYRVVFRGKFLRFIPFKMTMPPSSFSAVLVLISLVS